MTNLLTLSKNVYFNQMKKVNKSVT